VRSSGGCPATSVPISFTPHLVPMSRGLLATAYASLTRRHHRRRRAGGPARRLRRRAVRARPAPGTFPHTKALAGSNGCQLSALVDQRTGRVVVTSAIDNLGKGAAGQALQNANLLLGIEETTGLPAIGMYP
jgi:N-acetyl-gamma-glutamyl-phosphate reductase